MKKILLVVCALLCANMVMAEFTPPTKEINWFNDGETSSEAEGRTGIRRTGTQSGNGPIAPATLLLLGLGGAAVGTKVVRNRRKE